MAKEKGQTPLEDEVVKVPNDKEQDIHEEDPRPRVVEPYRPLVPFPQHLAKAKLEAKFEKFLVLGKNSSFKIYKHQVQCMSLSTWGVTHRELCF